MLNDRENILNALREKPLKVYEIMKRANVVNEEACQSLLLKMRGEGLVKFDIQRTMAHRIDSAKKRDYANRLPTVSRNSHG
jgi:hypothetical protein